MLDIKGFKATFSEWRKSFVFWKSVAVLLISFLSYLNKGEFLKFIGSSLISNIGSFENELVMGVIALISVLLIVVLISTILLFRSRLNESKKSIIEKDEKIKSKEELIKKLESKLKDNDQYIGNVKFIEKIIRDKVLNDYGDLGEMVNDKISDNLTILPIKYDFLKSIANHDLIILSSRTKIRIKDLKGTTAEYKRRIHIFPQTSTNKRINYEAFFDAKTKLHNLVIGDKAYTQAQLDEKMNITSKGVDFKILHPKKDIKAYEFISSTIEIGIDDCFTSKKEYWVCENIRYPILYDRVQIELKKQPKEHNCLIWTSDQQEWRKANSTEAFVLDNGKLKRNGFFSIVYFLNFQDAYKDEDTKVKFKVEWEID